MNPQIRQLTGLRFLAAFGVVLCHYAPEIHVPPAWLFLTDFGGSFVALFFVLSGFVLTVNYPQLAGPANRQDRFDYAVARLARILPVYWLALALTALVYQLFGFPPLGRSPAEWARAFAVNLLALQAWVPDFLVQQGWNAPGWSISSELFFYACLPTLLKCRWIDGTMKGFVRIWLGLVGSLLVYWAVLATAPMPEGPGKEFLWQFPVRLPLFGIFCFAFGVNLARRHEVRSSAGGSNQRGVTLLAGSFAVLLTAWACYRLKQGSSMGRVVEVLCIYAVYTPYFCALIDWLVRSRGVWVRGLSSNTLVFLGHSSYALYLIHWVGLMVLWLDPRFAQRGAGVGLLCMLACVTLSALIYPLFEDPLRRAIRRAGRRVAP